MQSIWLALNLAFLRDAVTIVRKNLGRVCLSRFTLYPATICLSLSLQPFFFFIYNDTFAQFSIILQSRRRRSLEFYFGISILVENSFSTRAPF